VCPVKQTELHTRAHCALYAHLRLGCALHMSMSIAARVLELAWTTGVIYVLSRLFVARARIEIVSYSRKNS